MKKELALLVCIVQFSIAYAKADRLGADSLLKTQKPNPTTLQRRLPFPIGASINVELLKNNPAYRKLVVREFNSVTAENAMKMSSIQTSKDVFNWAQADYLVDFAIAHKKRVHGHTLNWYEALPDWVQNFNGTTAEWENLLKTHIQTVVTHFRGKVTSWDVVNEAIAEDGTFRNTIWTQKFGIDYIGRAFQYAHEADPGALLFYNDYGNDYCAVKRAAIIKLVTDLKTKGIPIDGIGMQMHTRYDQPDGDILEAINTAVATGLNVHISELDISLNPEHSKDLTYTVALGKLQAAKYKFIVKTYNSIPKLQQFGITTWNVTDGDSWIPQFYQSPDWPLHLIIYIRKNQRTREFWME